MRTRLVHLLVAGAIALGGMTACGGGGGGVSTTPPGTGTTPPASANPCASVSAEAPEVVPTALTGRSKGEGVLHDSVWTWLDARWTRRVASRRLGEGDTGIRPADRDAGEIAVLEDNGRLLVPANAFDLVNRGLRFQPGGGGGFVASTADAPFRAALGTRLSLSDDDSSAVTLPFAFPFFGRQETAAAVNSDGNVTFGAGDSASTARNVTRFLAGPPRVALFFADLDPSAGGSVWVNASAAELTVTWCGVPGFESGDRVTAQVTLLADGAVEMRYADPTTLRDAVVGVSPGTTTEFVAADLSSGAQAGARVAVGERFGSTADIDLEAAAARFYASHADDYDQLVFWTDQRVVGSRTFAFEMTVANAIRGLGLPVFDESRAYGSAGRLSSVVVMDTLAKYPDDPRRTFLGENSTVSVLGQEVGHRWLTFFRFLDVNRQVSEAILGRDLAHWGFFVDSDASVMEGNDIADLGGGAFRTVGAVSRFSRTDLYAMGLAAETDVPPFFYVEAPVNVSPPVSGNDAAPQTGVTFNGTRRDVRLQDIVDVMGRRDPPASAAPRLWRQAIIYLVGGGRQADGASIDKLERIRVEWEPFYLQAVEGRGRVETRLRP